MRGRKIDLYDSSNGRIRDRGNTTPTPKLGYSRLKGFKQNVTVITDFLEGSN